MTTSKNITMEREDLDALQNMMWTQGNVISAIAGTRNIDSFETTLLRPMEDGDPLKEITAIAIIIRVEAGESEYQLADKLEQKIEAAKKKFMYEHERGWKAYVHSYNLRSTISTSWEGYRTITIKITVR